MEEIVKTTSKTKKTATTEPDYENMYIEEVAKNKKLTALIDEYKKLCHDYALNAQNTEIQLQQATLEYNTRVQYISDCIKHAYLSAQYAIAASKKSATKGAQNND